MPGGEKCKQSLKREVGARMHSEWVGQEKNSSLPRSGTPFYHFCAKTSYTSQDKYQTTRLEALPLAGLTSHAPDDGLTAVAMYICIYVRTLSSFELYVFCLIFSHSEAQYVRASTLLFFYLRTLIPVPRIQFSCLDPVRTYPPTYAR